MRHTKKHIQKIAVALGIMMMFGLSYVAHAATTKVVELSAGKADTVTLKSSIADVLVANPAIADVGSLRSNRLYIVGKAVGTTNVLAFDDVGNQLADITVNVKVDEDNLSAVLKEFFPKEEVGVRTVNSDIVLTGKVSNPSVANRVRDLASRFVTDQTRTIVDLMKVQGEQQVMLKVKVIEVSRNALREYGIETDYRPNATLATDSLFNTIGGTGLQSLAPFGAGQLFFEDSTLGIGPLKVAIQGMENDGLINTLAEPNLTAISGETAGFLAGGEYPVPVGRDQDGNVTLEFKSFGVSLNFTPTVLSEDRISMQLSTEVSSKSAENSVTLVNTVIPGLSVRRAETTVQMGSGGTLMIAGLIQSNTLDGLNGFPGIQDVPILGELFKSKSFKRNESELLILVTPYIVEPFAQPDAVREASRASTPVRMLPDGTAFPTPVPAVAPLEKTPVQKSSLDSSSKQATQQARYLKKTSYPRYGEERTASMSHAVQQERATSSSVIQAQAPVTGVEQSALVAAKPAWAHEDAKQVVASATPSKTFVAPAPKPQVFKSTPSESLSDAFVDNLKQVYGRKAPEKTAVTGAGYIVD